MTASFAGRGNGFNNELWREASAPLAQRRKIVFFDSRSGKDRLSGAESARV